MGRLLWTLRRLFLCAFVCLLISLFNRVSIAKIIAISFPVVGIKSIYSILMLFSAFGLITVLIISVFYAVRWYEGERNSVILILEYILDDILFPIHCIFTQIIVGIYYEKTGKCDVEWGGIIFDFLWTLFLLLFFIINTLILLH